jgi:hypothetical protein
VKEFAIKNRRNIQFEKNDIVRVKVVCKGDVLGIFGFHAWEKRECTSKDI